jgi:membrane protein
MATSTERPRTTSASPGREADRPTDVPAKGWLAVAKRVKGEAKRDNVPLLAAGVAFFALLALVPALVALVSLYGLIADPDEVERQVTNALAAAPSEVRNLVQAQLTSITEDTSRSAGVLALVLGVAVALWSASSGMSHLVEAVNAAYDEEETRGFVKKRAISLGLTIGAIVFLVVAFTVIALLPALLAETGLGSGARAAIGVVRWVLLIPAMIVGLAVLYRYAPDRDEPRWSWASPGAIVATVVWIVASLLFSLYSANFGSFNETYGSLAAVVVMMLWLWITALAVILGAELNAELERQTAQDTTEGREEPMGERRAYAADTVAE